MNTIDVDEAVKQLRKLTRKEQAEYLVLLQKEARIAALSVAVELCRTYTHVSQVEGMLRAMLGKEAQSA